LCPGPPRERKPFLLNRVEHGQGFSRDKTYFGFLRYNRMGWQIAPGERVTKRALALSMCLVLSVFPGINSLAQEPATAPESAQISLRQKVLYNEISVYLQDGPVLFGFLAGVEPEALIVRKDGQDIKVPRQRLRRIVLETETNINRNMVYGMVAGLYAGNILLLHDSYMPFAITKKLEENEPWLGFLFEPAIMASGLGLGFLATLLESGEKTFDFGPSEASQRATWENWLGFIARSPEPPKIHFSIHAGSVATGFTSHYDGLLRKAGFDSYTGPGSGRFNLLRRAQVTYSLFPPAEIGLAYLSASEPNSYYHFSSYDSETSVNMSLEPGHVQQGLYLVGAFRPRLTQKLCGTVGFGIGAARARYTFSGHRTVMRYVLDPVTQSYWTWVTSEEKELACQVTRSFFSGFAFAEITIRFYEGLYLGISGDYAFRHTEGITAFEDFGLPAWRARLASGSIGLAISWHF